MEASGIHISQGIVEYKHGLIRKCIRNRNIQITLLFERTEQNINIVGACPLLQVNMCVDRTGLKYLLCSTKYLFFCAPNLEQTD